jgi:hypothetical protein
VRLCDALFSSCHLDLLKARFRHVSALPPSSVSTFLEGVLASPDSDQVGGSSSSHGALSSLQAPVPTLQRLDVCLRMRWGGFSFLILVHPMRLHRRHVFTLLQRDFVSTASPTR